MTYNIKISEDNKPIIKKFAKDLDELELTLEDIDRKFGFGGKKNSR